MYLNRIEVVPGNPAGWLGAPYLLHQTVWSWFSRGENDTRSFLYRSDGETVIALSEEPPSSTPGWHTVSKPYNPCLSVGDRLSFTMRINPTVRKDGHRHDVVMHKKKQLQLSATTDAGTDVVQTSVSEWLLSREERLGVSFCPESLQVEGYNRVSFRKRSGCVDFHQVDVQGIFKVKDVQKAASFLQNGVGNARSFGCGLVLVKRA